MVNGGGGGGEGDEVSSSVVSWALWVVGDRGGESAMVCGDATAVSDASLLLIDEDGDCAPPMKFSRCTGS